MPALGLKLMVCLTNFIKRRWFPIANSPKGAETHGKNSHEMIMKLSIGETTVGSLTDNVIEGWDAASKNTPRLPSNESKTSITGTVILSIRMKKYLTNHCFLASIPAAFDVLDLQGAAHEGPFPEKFGEVLTGEQLDLT
jgi:hypothetical protein